MLKLLFKEHKIHTLTLSLPRSLRKGCQPLPSIWLRLFFDAVARLFVLGSSIQFSHGYIGTVVLLRVFFERTAPPCGHGE